MVYDAYSRIYPKPLGIAMLIVVMQQQASLLRGFYATDDAHFAYADVLWAWCAVDQRKARHENPDNQVAMRTMAQCRHIAKNLPALPTSQGDDLHLQIGNH